MDNEKNILAFRIKELRTDLKLTQEELALKLGLKGKSSIANYEKGTIVSSDEVKLKMCKLFNCTMDYLMGTSNYKTSFDEFLNIKHSNISLKDFSDNIYFTKKDFVLLVAHIYKKIKNNELDTEFTEESKLRISQLYEGFIKVPKLKKIIDDYNLNPERYQYSNKIPQYELKNSDYVDIFEAFNLDLTDYERNFVFDCLPNESIDENIKYFNGDENRKKYIVYAYNEILSFIRFLYKKYNEPIKPMQSFSNIEDIVNYKRILEKCNINKDNIDNFSSVPIVGRIAAGQPILVQENIEGYLPVDPGIYGMTTSDELFYLRVSGESMNLKIKNGDYALIHKQDYAEDGEIIAVIVNSDDEATLKKYRRLNEQFVLLEPMSSDTSIEAITVDLKNTKFQIIGKAIGQFGKF